MDQKIMDYSLLVGIHDISRGNRDRIRDSTLSVFEPNARTLSRRATATTRSVKQQISKEASHIADLQQFGPSTAIFSDHHLPPERRYCFFYQDEGGYRATGENNAPLKELYYLGIIDIFTYYSAAKRTETIYLSIANDKVFQIN
jgi:hypothetical protein